MNYLNYVTNHNQSTNCSKTIDVVGCSKTIDVVGDGSKEEESHITI